MRQQISPLTTHPHADLFPMLPEAELHELAEDIRHGGQQQPIIVDADDRIVDGRNRFEACRLAGVEPVIEARDLSDAEALTLVVSANLHRRHLDASQRGAIAAKLETMRHGGKRRNQDANLHLERNERRVSRAEAARLMNVSPRLVACAAKVIAKGSPELQRAVEAGEISVSKAAASLGPSRRGSPAIRSVADELAQKAIDLLKRIPVNDPHRKRGFQFVRNFVDLNEDGLA